MVFWERIVKCGFSGCWGASTPNKRLGPFSTQPARDFSRFCKTLNSRHRRVSPLRLPRWMRPLRSEESGASRGGGDDIPPPSSLRWDGAGARPSMRSASAADPQRRAPLPALPCAPPPSLPPSLPPHRALPRLCPAKKAIREVMRRESSRRGMWCRQARR